MDQPHDNLDPVSALSQIQDDEAEKLEAQYWAVDQILAGVAPEAIVADLLGQGWDSDTAEEIAEQARKTTRNQRGVVTREAVASGLDAKYRRSQKRAALLFRFFLLGIVVLIFWLVAKIDFKNQVQHEKPVPQVVPPNNPSVGTNIQTGAAEPICLRY